MNSMKIGMKITKIVSKPVKMFFGSDEKSFMTLFGVMVLLYFSGYPDAATITAVYDAVFAYAGMQKYNNTSDTATSSKSDDLEDMQDMMEDALGMAQEFQEKGETSE